MFLRNMFCSSETLFPLKSILCACCVAVVFANCFSAAPSFAQEPVAENVTFKRDVVPFLKKHCTSCHGGEEPEGGLQFDKYKTNGNVQQDYERWETIQRVVREFQMPPADMEQPKAAEIDRFIAGIDAELSTFDCSDVRRPGRVTIRRLNKVEYNNTIRDLVGLDLNLADDFPSDDVGEGFDNIGDVLTLPPLLLEKYLAAAQTIATTALKDPTARRKILARETDKLEEKIAAARENAEQFAERAFRRPIRPEELERLFNLMKFAYEQGARDDEIAATFATAVLTSPHFLYRIEKDPSASDADGIRELDDFELATRLSYFLWSTMPDRELFDLARAGKLSDPDTLDKQVRRMIADEKSMALIHNFAGQWLQLRDVTRLSPDPDLFRINSQLQADMRRETEVLFRDIMQNDRSVLTLLTADYSFVNERLARHYGMPDVKGEEFQRVALVGNRRGILTHASILMLTSNPTRTSPVKRGKWILDNILGEPPPDPPANVPELEDSAETLGSLREKMEQHRANESCAVCHRKMDALGFGLENFNAVGAWREKDGRFAIDSSGTLPGNQRFRGPVELIDILVDDKKNEFCRTMTRKMLTYALGRGLTSWDRCTVKRIVQNAEKHDYRFSSLVLGIVKSDAFRFREAKPE